MLKETSRASAFCLSISAEPAHGEHVITEKSSTEEIQRDPPCWRVKPRASSDIVIIILVEKKKFNKYLGNKLGNTPFML